MIFVGNDWAEDHHDIDILDEAGRRLGRKRLPEGVAGVTALHDLIAGFAEEPSEVVVGIETDRGLWVAALVAAGYQVYAVNPKAAARYRERHSGSGAKSDTGDAKMLADLVRTDRHNHRPVAGDSPQAEAVNVLAQAHQRLVWSRRRQINSLRAVLREFYPAALAAFGEDLAHPDALAVLQRAPTPRQARALKAATLAAALRRGGRQRNVAARANEIRDALRAEQLAAPEPVADAYGTVVSTSVAVLGEMNRQLGRLETQLEQDFEEHPDAEIIRTQPGLGVILGARVLGEFGDDPNRYADAKARKNYAATSPITVASGKRKVVKTRYIGNRHLTDACYLWAFSALTASPGARLYYDTLRNRGNDHNGALRALGNRLVGILDGCLRHRALYDEHTAWGHRSQQAA